MTAIDADQQLLQLGQFVQLFTLDTSSLGGGVLYWTPSRPNTTTPIIWQGNTYTSVDISADGFDRTATGVSPRPKLSVSNADNVVGALLSTYDDILGCIVTRTKTLYKYLDNQPAADATAYWPTDVYRVERKVSQNKNLVVVELAAATDNAGARIPARVVLRDGCSHLYRRYSNGSFDYSKATCPYVGTFYFDRNGNPVSAVADVCGKKLSDCRARFGTTAVLPYAGFPGVARVRIS